MMDVASDLEAEAAGLAEAIRQHQGKGTPYRDQAILCRSHTNLARFAMRLEALGIPVLYLGDLFERPEIRDMLSLTSFTCEPQRGGLLRLAGFPEYRIPLADVRAVLAFAAAQSIYPLQALSRLGEITGLTAEGRKGLALLGAHLAFVKPETTPSNLLAEYLFSQSRYLDPLLKDSSVAGQQKRLAIYQLLQFAIEHKPVGAGNARRKLLQWIRRLETFGDERQLRQLPSAAAGIDAVRLLTVHASKGLEFSVVYLPALATSIFPVNPQYTQCPLPAGLLSEDPKASHAEEEECLFFVAMSRARDHLHFSRAERYGTARSASSLLIAIAAHLPYSPQASPTWRDSGIPTADDEPLVHLAATREVHNAEDLDQYMKCRRAYLYQRILDLSGARDDNPYVKFHRAVYRVLRWMNSVPTGTAITREIAIAELDKAWEEIGPAKHHYAQVYRTAADGIVERAVARLKGGIDQRDADWTIELPAGRVRVRPDHVEMGPSGAVVRRLRTGRPPKKIDDDIYALYIRGAQQELGSARVEALYLTTDETVPVPMSSTVVNNRLEKYNKAIAGIHAGYFAPDPDDRNCPRCPQYFICPGIPAESYKD